MEAELVGSCGDEKSCEVPTKMNSFFCNASIAVHTPPVAKKESYSNFYQIPFP